VLNHFHFRSPFFPLSTLLDSKRKYTSFSVQLCRENFSSRLPLKSFWFFHLISPIAHRHSPNTTQQPLLTEGPSQSSPRNHARSPPNKHFSPHSAPLVHKMVTKGILRALISLAALTTLLLVFYSYSSPPIRRPHTGGSETGFVRPKTGGSLKGIDPLLNPEKGPPGRLWGPGEAERTSATLLSLVRNNELEGMISAMRDLERTFNHKFNYPWTFFNDEEFSQEFKERTQAETKAECRYGELSSYLHNFYFYFYFFPAAADSGLNRVV